jgi:hypothetical protein
MFCVKGLSGFISEPDLTPMGRYKDKREIYREERERWDGKERQGTAAASWFKVVT